MKKNTKIDPMEFVAKNGYPEVGTFASEKDLQRFYKKLDIATIEDWAAIEGLEYKPCPTSEPIHRMRVCMSILRKHFPKEAATKQKSKYAEFSLEDLVSMAADAEVPVEMCDDDRILRMRLIMALRASKVIG